MFVVWLLGSLQKSYKTNDSIGVHTDRGGCCLPYKTPRRRGRGFVSKPCLSETLFETGSRFRQTDGSQQEQHQRGKDLPRFSAARLHHRRSWRASQRMMHESTPISRRFWGCFGSFSSQRSLPGFQAESARPCCPKIARSSPVIDLFWSFWFLFHSKQVKCPD